MNDKEVFDKMIACGFNAGHFEFTGYYKGFRVVTCISSREIRQSPLSDQLKELLIAKTRVAKEMAIAEFNAIEKKISEVFDER